jgi:hypothetical protein
MDDLVAYCSYLLRNQHQPVLQRHLAAAMAIAPALALTPLLS